MKLLHEGGFKATIRNHLLVCTIGHWGLWNPGSPFRAFHSWYIVSSIWRKEERHFIAYNLFGSNHTYPFIKTYFNQEHKCRNWRFGSFAVSSSAGIPIVHQSNTKYDDATKIFRVQIIKLPLSGLAEVDWGQQRFVIYEWQIQLFPKDSEKKSFSFWERPFRIHCVYSVQIITQKLYFKFWHNYIQF